MFLRSNFFRAHAIYHLKSPFSLLSLGCLIGGLLIFAGLVFRTYMISMPSVGMEMARQLGALFVIAELAVIIIAIHKGFNLLSVWNILPKLIKLLAISFLTTFWIGSVVFSEAPFLSLLHNIIFLIHIVFAASISWGIGKFDEDSLDLMVASVSIALVIFCGMIAYAFVFHPPLNSMPDNQIVWQFAIPGFISVRLFGAFCGALFCLILGALLLAEEHKRVTLLHFFALTLCATMVIWSGTRAAIVGCIGATLLISWVYNFRPSLKTSIVICFAMVVASLVAFALIPYNDPAFFLISPHDTLSAESVSGGRVSYWTAVWEAYMRVPVFGGGPFASFFLIAEGEQIHVQPHNIILQFLITWGPFASVTALALLAIATWHAHKIAYTERRVLPFLLMLDCLLIMSFFDGMTHFAQHLMLIMICFGVIYGQRRIMPTDFRLQYQEA